MACHTPAVSFFLLAVEKLKKIGKKNERKCEALNFQPIENSMLDSFMDNYIFSADTHKSDVYNYNIILI